MKAFTTIAICALCLSGCRTSPTPPTASTEIPESHDWSQELDYGLSTKPGDLSEWWKELGDPLLNRLIAASLKQNLDLRQGASRIREARAQRGIAEASRFPTLKTSGSAQKSKTGEAPASEVFAAGFDATWELDVFGRVSKSIEAAGADLAAVKESYYDLRISLLAEVALNYIEVRSFQNRLAIARENLKAQQETYRIAKARFDAKITSELDVKQAETNFLNTQSGIPPLEAGLKRAMNRLAVLLGRKPGALGKELSKEAPIPVGPAAIAVGVPADLMRRRPDIRKAERELAAQSARVGVAKADLYPRFTLSGNLSLQATDAAKLFSPTGRKTSFGPAFQWNVFSAGSIRNNIRAQTEKQKQALARYEQTILLALEEAENALSAHAREHARRIPLSQSVATSQTAVKLADDQYKAGVKDFLTVLDAQRTLFNQQDQLAISDANIISNLIRLYKALGGGWNPNSSQPEK